MANVGRTRTPRKTHITVIGGENEKQKKPVRKPTDPVSHEYDQNEFRVPGQDVRGHKEHLSFDIPPGYKNQMGIMLGSQRFPYETEGQLIRHAVKRHLAWLAELEVDVPNDLSALRLIDEAVSRQETLLRLNQSLHRIEQAVHELTTIGLRGEAVRLVWEMRDAVEDVTQPQWYNYLIDQIETRWGHMLQTRPLKVAQMAASSDGDGE